jgi:hypothetical protein
MKVIFNKIKWLVFAIIALEIYNLGLAAMDYPNTFVFYLGFIIIATQTILIGWFAGRKLFSIISKLKND